MWATPSSTAASGTSTTAMAVPARPSRNRVSAPTITKSTNTSTGTPSIGVNAATRRATKPGSPVMLGKYAAQ